MKEYLKSKFSNYFSTGPKVVLIVVLLVIGVTIGIYSTRKTVIVFIDSKEVKFVTYNNTFRKALKSNNIIVGPKDKTTPSLDTRVNNGDRITIKKAINIEIAIDGKNLKINSAEDNIEQMFEAEKITVDDFDKVFPARNQVLTQGLKVSVVRVKTELVKETKSIAFATVQKLNDDMEKGISKIIQEGQIGEEEITTKIVYEDGKEIARQVVSQVTNKQPVQKILATGTLGTVPNLSRGGTKVLYQKSIRVKATAYTPYETGGWRTASGSTARRDINGVSTIAVDPRVIPLGTRVYVEGYGYAVAEDTGGAIKGNIIDVFFSSNSEMSNWGTSWVNIYILK
jgi:uncharacterized protein YabE (DUF348 family)